jgi:toluene monooxygenase system protein E
LPFQGWDDFSDPKETTYSRYVAQAHEREAFVDGLLEIIETTDYDQRLPPPWLHALERLLAPLPYPLHGLQMVAAFIGSSAPSGRVAVASAFQAANHMRLIQRIAYRSRQLQECVPGFAENRRQIWQADAAWQPLRRQIELLLTTYDWTRAFVLKNLILEPLVCGLFLVHLGAVANAAGDEILSKILRTALEDHHWHAEWSGAVLALVLQDEGNRRKVEGLISEQHQVALELLDAAESLFADAIDEQSAASIPPLRQTVLRHVEAQLDILSLTW